MNEFRLSFTSFTKSNCDGKSDIAKNGCLGRSIVTFVTFTLNDGKHQRNVSLSLSQSPCGINLHGEIFRNHDYRILDSTWITSSAIRYHFIWF